MFCKGVGLPTSFRYGFLRPTFKTLNSGFGVGTPQASELLVQRLDDFAMCILRARSEKLSKGFASQQSKPTSSMASPDFVANGLATSPATEGAGASTA